ncbi:MAG: CCA tRNA nucleotidyltransferase [Deltaproteobacteria bacterium]|nr:CCA tRNA nucleotidyltransferase [Deltaproteobacteria bacterium]
MSEPKDMTEQGRLESALSNFRVRLSALKHDPVLKEIFSLVRREGVRAYLVGGVLRNIALSREVIPDYDFAVGGDVEAFSAKVADRLKGSSFLLDKETLSCRVVVKSDSTEYMLDFSPVKSDDIYYDLKARDFTMNAMGVEVVQLFEGEPEIIDPCGGFQDSAENLLRAASKDAFDEDPLRCLRAIRLSQQYGLEIEEETLELIKAKSELVSGTSAERVREETVLMFSSPNTGTSLKRLYDTGIVKVILPEINDWADVDGYNLLSHTLNTLEEAEKLLSNISEKTFPQLSENLKTHFSGFEGSIKKEAFFKMAAFFHDFGKPYAISREQGRLRFIGHDFEGSRHIVEVLTRLKFSRRVINELANLIKNHHRVFMFAVLAQPSFRAKSHFFRAVGGEAGLDLLCLALADARATRGGEDEELYKIVLGLMRFYYEVYIKEKPRPLIGGDDIMETFGILPGRLVGEILSEVSRGVETGIINNRKQALEHIRKWLKGKKK